MTTEDTAEAPVRVRDASRTRALLLDAGRRRFSGDGYAGTTTRDIAQDAGVDVALIKRYFGSKEGLFEACLDAAVDELLATTRTTATPADLPERIARVALGLQPGKDDDRVVGTHALLLLLRTSGEPAVDARRRDVLHRLSGQLARALAGGEASAEHLLRAQVVLSAAVGVALLRSSPGLDPLRTASSDEIASVLRDLLPTVP